MNGTNRINLNDSLMDSLIKISDGNPGALRVSSDILKQGGDIDPRHVLGGMGHVLMLDEYGIYGSDIWGMYQYVCGGNLSKMVGLIRAAQLNVTNVASLREAISKEQPVGGTNDTQDAILRAVVERLPETQITF